MMANNRFKYRAWNKIEKKMYTGLPCSGAGENGHDTFDIVLKFPQVYEISQCVNMHDSEKVLVFEGDYLSDGETVWEVVYRKSMSGFSAKAAGGRIPDECGWFSLYHLCNGHHGGRKVRVVGNRYEYKGNPSDLLSRDVEEEERTQP